MLIAEVSVRIGAGREHVRGSVSELTGTAWCAHHANITLPDCIRMTRVPFESLRGVEGNIVALALEAQR